MGRNASSHSKCTKCKICALGITWLVLSGALIYFNAFDQKLLNEYLPVDELKLAICVMFVFFSFILLMLVYYISNQNEKVYPNYNRQEKEYIIPIQDTEEDSTVIKGLKSKNNQMSDELSICRANLNTMQEKNETLTRKNNALSKQIGSINKGFERQEQKYEAKIKVLEDKLLDLGSKQQTINEMVKTCKTCETYKQEIILLKEKLSISSNNTSDQQLAIANTKLTMRNQTLQEQLNKLQGEYDELEKYRNQLQDRLCDLNPNVLSVNSTFPKVEDMVLKFDTLRGQNRQNCAKKVKKYFKKQPENANASKYWFSKQANQLLFRILMDCYKKMKQYYVIVNKRYDNDNTDQLNKVVYLRLRNEFESLFDEVKVGYTNDIVQNKVDNYKGIYKFCAQNEFVEYVEECLYICWFVNVSQSPPLKLYPIILEDNDDEKKENEQYSNTLKQHYTDKSDIYEFVSGSEEKEALNYHMWPCIVRTDNNFLLSKIHAFFMDEIPTKKNKS